MKKQGPTINISLACFNQTLSDGANGDPRSFKKERAQNSGSGGGPKTSVRFFSYLIRVGLKLQKCETCLKGASV